MWPMFEPQLPNLSSAKVVPVLNLLAVVGAIEWYVKLISQIGKLTTLPFRKVTQEWGALFGSMFPTFGFFDMLKISGLGDYGKIGNF